MVNSDSFKASKEMMNPYMKEELFRRPKPKPKISYGKEHVQIGRVAKTGDVYTLNVKEASRMLILGLTRSGKTFLMREIFDRLKQIGFDIVHLCDVKDEFHSSNEPVQEKFQHLLLPGEKPTALKVVTLRPTFFKQVNEELKKRNFWYSIDINKLTRADFNTLFNIEELTPNQRTAFELIFQELQNRFKKDSELKFSVDLLYDIIDEDPDIDQRQKQGLRFKIKPLEQSHFFEEEYQRSVVDLLNRDFVPTINLEDFDYFGKGNFLFPEVTLNIILSEIINARKAEKIKKVWIGIDEASRFIGKTKRNSIKTSVEESFELHTRYGVSYALCYQSWGDVPEKIVENTRYILVPRSADVNTIRAVLTNTGLVKNVQIAPNTAIRLKKEMAKHPHSWAILDRMEATMEVIIPLGPLSMHMESTK